VGRLSPPEMLESRRGGVATPNSLRESVASAASVNTVDFTAWISKSRGELQNHQNMDVERTSYAETVESYEGDPANLNPFLSASEAQSQTAHELNPFDDPTNSVSDVNTLAGEGPLYTVMEETEPAESIRQTIRSSMSSNTQGSLTPRSSIAETHRSSLTRNSSYSHGISEQARESSEAGRPSGSTYSDSSPTSSDFKIHPPRTGVVPRHYAPHPASPVDAAYGELGEDWNSTVQKTTTAWKTSSILGL